MPRCERCGEDNPARARFCLGCGTPLAGVAAGREVRKTVTVVFSDLVESTPLGERLDPESLREVISRYYDRAAQVLSRHGGTVAKFIGDAVMAVFGIPWLHEDDALRAVRAAGELGDALEELNAELEAAWGVRLTLRTGVNTGEVVVGDAVHGQDLVVGDAVNVAARLEQAAGPGGPGYYALMRLDEFVASRVVEAVVHGLDVTDALGREPMCTPEGVAVTASILDELLARRTVPGRPADLAGDDLAWVRAASGRGPAHPDPRLPLIG